MKFIATLVVTVLITAQSAFALPSNKQIIAELQSILPLGKYEDKFCTITAEYGYNDDNVFISRITVGEDEVGTASFVMTWATNVTNYEADTGFLSLTQKIAANGKVVSMMVKDDQYGLGVSIAESNKNIVTCNIKRKR